MAPDMLVDTDRGDPIEPGGIIDQYPPPFDEDGVVCGVPGHSQAGRDAGDGEVPDDEAFQRPPLCAAGDLRPRLGCARRVLPPDPAAAGALVSAHPDQQDRGSPPEGLMGETARHAGAHDTLRAALQAPRIRVNDPAFEHRPVGREVLADDAKAELVEAAEGREIRVVEGSVGRVEVFPMGV